MANIVIEQVFRKVKFSARDIFIDPSNHGVIIIVATITTRDYNNYYTYECVKAVIDEPTYIYIYLYYNIIFNYINNIYIIYNIINIILI